MNVRSQSSDSRKAGPLRGQAVVKIVEPVIEMPRNIYVVFCVLAMVTLIVGLDVLFFRHRFWERLMVNIGIVLVFVAFYLRFLNKP